MFVWYRKITTERFIWIYLWQVDCNVCHHELSGFTRGLQRPDMRFQYCLSLTLKPVYSHNMTRYHPSRAELMQLWAQPWHSVGTETFLCGVCLLSLWGVYSSHNMRMWFAWTQPVGVSGYEWGGMVGMLWNGLANLSWEMTTPVNDHHRP